MTSSLNIKYLIQFNFSWYACWPILTTFEKTSVLQKWFTHGFGKIVLMDLFRSTYSLRILYYIWMKCFRITRLGAFKSFFEVTKWIYENYMVWNPLKWKTCVDRNTEDNKLVYEKLCLENNNCKIALGRTIDNKSIIHGQTRSLCWNTSQSSAYYQELCLSWNKAKEGYFTLEGKISIQIFPFNLDIFKKIKSFNQ